MEMVMQTANDMNGVGNIPDHGTLRDQLRAGKAVVRELLGHVRSLDASASARYNATTWLALLDPPARTAAMKNGAATVEAGHGERLLADIENAEDVVDTRNVGACFKPGCCGKEGGPCE